MSRRSTRFLTLLALAAALTAQAGAQEASEALKKVPVKEGSDKKARPSKERQKRAKARAAAEAEAKAKAVNVNLASKEALMKLPGVTAAYADAIIAKRPYNSKADLVVKGAIPEALFLSLRKQVAAR